MTESKGKFTTTQYPSIVGSPTGWWHKPINPVISIIILVLALLFVFLLGVWFVIEYDKIYLESLGTLH
ncbi:MAG: hypothetical protein ACP5IX_01250 [Patescibacteria group bacterium]